MTIKQTVRSIARVARVGVVTPLRVTADLYGGTDKSQHGYTDHYPKHLAGRRFRRNRILEIGVGGYESTEAGGSLRLWRDYFPRSQIVGLDLHHKEVDLGSLVRFVQGDQSSPNDLDRSVAALGGPPDIVLDDGSHLAGHAIASFEHLFPLMPSGSIYVVEDLSTSYWKNWGGALEPSDSTAIGLAKALANSVQARDSTFVRKPHWGPTPEFDRNDVAALHVYPGVFFVEKAKADHLSRRAKR